MQMNSKPLRVLIHAPTAAAVTRARNNAANIRQDAPDAEIRIVANAEGVAAVLDTPRDDTDSLTYLCGITLKRTQREATGPLQTVPGAALAIARMQQDGWCYIRA